MIIDAIASGGLDEDRRTLLYCALVLARVLDISSGIDSPDVCEDTARQFRSSTRDAIAMAVIAAFPDGEMSDLDRMELTGADSASILSALGLPPSAAKTS